MANLPIGRASDSGWARLRRQKLKDQRDAARRTSSSSVLRRGNFTNAPVGPAVVSDGTTLDELLELLQDTRDDLAAAVSRLGNSQAPAAITLSSSFVAYATIGAPTAQLLNGQMFLVGAAAPAPGVTLTAGSVYPIGQLPYGAPPAQVNRRCTGQGGSSDTSVRGIVNPSGLVQVAIGATVPAWIDLSALSAYIPAPPS